MEKAGWRVLLKTGAAFVSAQSFCSIYKKKISLIMAAAEIVAKEKAKKNENPVLFSQLARLVISLFAGKM